MLCSIRLFCELMLSARHLSSGLAKPNDDIDDMKLFRLSSKCLVWGAGQIPQAAKQRMEAATEEWKGERLGTLLGFKHTKAPNQVTGYLCSLFFAESTRESIVEAVSKMRGWGSAYRSLAAGDEDTFRLILIKLNSNSKTFTREQRLQLNVYLN